MAKRERPPPPIVRRADRGLVAVTAYDAEEIDAYPVGTEFDLVARTKRSWPQLRTYWRTLGNVVEATGKWQSPEALHTALKVKLGLVEPIFDMRGNVMGMQAESAALDKMDHKTFCAYFDRAATELSAAVGYDVLAWYNEGR